MGQSTEEEKEKGNRKFNVKTGENIISTQPSKQFGGRGTQMKKQWYNLGKDLNEGVQGGGQWRRGRCGPLWLNNVDQKNDGNNQDQKATGRRKDKGTN